MELNDTCGVSLKQHLSQRMLIFFSIDFERGSRFGKEFLRLRQKSVEMNRLRPCVPERNESGLDHWLDDLQGGFLRAQESHYVRGSYINNLFLGTDG